jgi:PAS domain S-box-containing protein
MNDRARPEESDERDSALERLMARSASAMLLVDDQRRYVQCNEAACDLLGMGREEVLELRIEDLSAPELRDIAPEMFQAFLQAGSQAGDYVLESPSGRRVTCSYSASANVVPGLHLSILIPTEAADPELDAYSEEQETEKALLTSREREILTLLALGEDNQTIAAKIFISPETVRSHTRSARLRLGARSRSHAIALALQRGELDI